MPKKYTEVKCVFSLTLPKTSKKNAKMLMDELLRNIEDSSDSFDSLMPSYHGVFGEDDAVGYSYGFGKIKVS